MTDIERLMLTRCYLYAGMSTDPRTRNGAIALPAYDDAEFSGGNHHATSSPDRGTRASKLRRMIHAEEDAIMTAALEGVSLKGGTLYAAWAACSTCARLIIQAGIVRVVAHDAPHQHARTDWAEDIAEADEMLAEAGVELVRMPGPLGVEVLFAGEVIAV